mgnify:CR=1 FL=1
MTAPEPLPARAFNPHLAAGSDRMHAVVREMIGLLENYEKFYSTRKRKRRPADQKTFERTVEALVCDLISRELEYPGASIHLPLSNRVLRKKSRYKGVALGKTLPDVLRSMKAEEMSMVEMTKGTKIFRVIDSELNTTFSYGKQTTLRAGEKLRNRIAWEHLSQDDIAEDPEEEVILLRDKKTRSDKPGHLLEYRDTEKTNRLRTEMQTINRRLREAWIACSRCNIHTNRRRLRRIFQDGDFANGGRLYGGFWQSMKGKDRLAEIALGDDSTVELDVGQAGILALYAIAGAKPPEGDLYDLTAADIPTRCRDGIKKVMNAMVSSAKPLKRMPKGARETIPLQYTVRDIQRAIDAVHPALTHYWCSGLHSRVWRIESDALVRVLLELGDRGITALPVHDAILVFAEHSETAQEVMRTVFGEAFGVTPTITETWD